MQQILVGAIGGVAWAVIGTVRAKTKEEQKEFRFKPKKFLKSVLLGAAVGGYLAYSGTQVDISTIDAFLMNSGMAAPVVAITEKIASIIYDGGKELLSKLV